MKRIQKAVAKSPHTAAVYSLIIFLATLVPCASLGSREQGPLHEAEDRVIRYNESDDLADPVAALRKKLECGSAKLEFEPAHGYLVSLLKLLKIPASSQSLVFSKTSLQTELVTPETPRALYFNDEVYVSWVPGGDVIDIAATDPRKGPIFYTLAQRQSAANTPVFTRADQCFQCHIGPKTLNVPGHLLRSVVTSPTGYPISQVEGFSIGHASPFQYRWGGWYVSMPQLGFKHMGSLPTRVDASKYLSAGSDVVALLVLAHQVKMHNLLTRAGYETRYALNDRTAANGAARQSSQVTEERVAHVAEPLLEYMLFRDEAPLSCPLQGTSTFARDFAHAGPRDSKGRSLRELDLKSRLLRYPCSYLIYSEAFAALPPELKQYLWRRLFEILTGKDRSDQYSRMRSEDKQATFQILRETQPEFSAWLSTAQLPN